MFLKLKKNFNRQKIIFKNIKIFILDPNSSVHRQFSECYINLISMVNVWSLKSSDTGEKLYRKSETCKKNKNLRLGKYRP